MADNPVAPCAVVVVDTEQLTSQVIDRLCSLTERKLILDLEGINLCREGKLCIGQLTFPDAACIYLLDFIVLPNVLEVRGNMAAGSSLRSLLEDDAWMKFIFDPRSDVDCLYHTCGRVLPRNVVCLQLCEVALDRMKGEHRKYLHGLKKVLEHHLPPDQRQATAAIQDTGVRLFAPEKGGSYAVFEERPLRPEIVAYCCADVVHLQLLASRLWAPLNEQWAAWVRLHSTAHVGWCLLPGVVCKGPHKAFAPQ